MMIRDHVARDLNLELLDVLGKKVYVQCFRTSGGEFVYPIVVDHLPPGVFFISLQGEGLYKTMRMLVSD